MNEVYRTYWPQGPARARHDRPHGAVAVPGALIEITGVAVREGAERVVAASQGVGAVAQPVQLRHPERRHAVPVRAGRRPDLKDNTLWPATLRVQTRAVLDNAGEILEGRRHEFRRRGQRARVHHRPPRDFQAMNEAYRKYFPAGPPARATVKAALTSADFRVEITLVAVKARPAGRAFTTPLPDGNARPSRTPTSAPRCAWADRPLPRRHARGARSPTSGDAQRPGAGDVDPDRPHAQRLPASNGGDVVDGVVYLTDAQGFSPR